MDEFQSRISSNYEVAKSYYQQRRDNLRKIFSRDMEDATDSLIKYINNKSQLYKQLQYFLNTVHHKTISLFLHKLHGFRTYTGCLMDLLPVNIL